MEIGMEGNSYPPPDLLKDHFHYNPETGLFTRKATSSGPRSIIGRASGSLRKDGYVALRCKGYVVLAHRAAWAYMYGYYPIEIDHINRTRNDNRIANLRESGRDLNTMNQGGSYQK